MSRTYDDFHSIFVTKKTALLVGTVTNTQQRIATYEAKGNNNAASVEMERLQAAADVLDARGYYNNQTDKPQSGIAALDISLLAVAAVLAAVVL